MRNLISLFITGLALLVFSPLPVNAYAKGSQSCKECHKLDEQSAKTVLGALIPDMKVLSVGEGPVSGLWEVGFEAGGKKSVAYIDYSLKYVIAGNIISVAEKKNLTQESFLKINKVDFSQIPLQNALVMGDKNAPHKVVVFDDPDWPYCGKLHQEMKKVLETRKDVAFYIILYPLPMHKEAYDKAKAIMCEKSLSLLEDAFAKKPLPKPSCDTKVIDENMKLADKFGISGTPAIIFQSGMMVPGYVEAPAIIEQIDKK